MKIYLRFRFRFYLFALLILLTGILASCSGTPDAVPIDSASINPTSITRVRVVMDNNYPPYAFVDEKGTMQGILVDQWRLWEQRTGVKVEIVGLPWDQALGSMKNGWFDVIDTIFYTDERAKIFDFTKPYADINVRIFFPSSVSGVANIQSLQGFRVAVKKGDASANKLIQGGVKDLAVYNSYEEIVKAVADGKETFFVIDEPPALYFMYKYKIQDHYNYSEPLDSGQFHRAVKKGNTALLHLVEDGFSKISKEDYQAINDRWYGKHELASLKPILPYVGIGAAAATLLIATLVIFNRELQTRVKLRTTELEDALAHLKSSEALFREAIEFLPIPIGIADANGNLLEYNHKFTEIYGYTTKDLSFISEWMLKAYPDSIYRERVIAQWEDDAREATRTQSATPVREYRITGKDGRVHDAEIIMRSIGNLWLTSFVEITERKRIEVALRENQKFLADLIEYGGALIFVKDLDGRYELINRKWEEVTGLKRAQVIGRTDEELFPEPIGEQFRVNDLQTLEAREAIEMEETLEDANGTRYFLSVKFPLRDDSGFIRGICGMSTEITERKRAENALREAETKYRALVENAPEVIYLDNADQMSSNAYISSQVESLLGYAPDAFAANPELWHTLVHPDDYQLAADGITKTLTEGKAVDEYRMIRSDGSAIWVRDSSITVHDEKGQISFIQGFLQDITERKAVEDSLQQSQERYRTLFEDSPIPLMEEDFSELKKYLDELKTKGVQDLRAYFVENPDEVQRLPGMVRIIDVNNAAINWYQAESKEAMLVSLSQALSEDGYRSFVEEILLMDSSQHYEVAVSRYDRQGDLLHIIINGTVVPKHEKDWGRVLISIVDVTKRKQAEEELARQLDLLRGLRAIDQAIINNLDLSINLHILIFEITTQLHVDAASIVLFKNHTLQFGAGQGFHTDAKTFANLIAGGDLASRVTRERHNINIPNLQEMDFPSVPMRAIKEEGFIAYHGVPLIAKGQLLGVLEVFHRSALGNDPNWLTFLDMLAGQAAITINSATLFNDLQTSNINLELAYDTTLEGWSHALDLRDKETEGHTQRVTELTLQLAREFGFNDEELVHIKRGALLHDIGKMGIPDAILLKPGPLTDEEWVIMRKHATYAYDLLSPIQYLRPAIDIPQYHHERWNGSGYPHGLKGEAIPLTARIFAVIDAWDALTSDRPYRAAWSAEKVKDYLRDKAGTEFDPRVVDIFLKMMDNKEEK